MKILPMKAISTTYYSHFDKFCYHHQWIADWSAMHDDDNRSHRNVCNMWLISFSLAAIFFIRLFNASTFHVPNTWFVNQPEPTLNAEKKSLRTKDMSKELYTTVYIKILYRIHFDMNSKAKRIFLIKPIPK